MIARMLESDHDEACQITPGRKHVVILGGGFGGVYAALEFERILRRESSFDVTLVNRENFFLFTPMLHEVASSDLDMTNIVNPIRKLLRRVEFFHGEVGAIDLEQQQVRVTHGETHHGHTLPYDHLILALGSVTNFYNLPGLAARALTMKTLGDAIYLRNRSRSGSGRLASWLPSDGARVSRELLDSIFPESSPGPCGASST